MKQIGRISKLDKVMLVCALFIAFTIVYGIIKDNWKPICYLFLIIILITMAYNIYGYFDDRLPKKDGKVLKKCCQGDVIVHFHGTKYIYGNKPVYVDVDGVCVASLYRNGTLPVPLSSGTSHISVYRDPRNKCTVQYFLEEGLSIFLWSEGIPPTYLTAVVKGGEEFNDLEIKKAYEKMSKHLKKMYLESLLWGFIGFISFLWGMSFFNLI